MVGVRNVLAGLVFPPVTADDKEEVFCLAGWLFWAVVWKEDLIKESERNEEI